MKRISLLRHAQAVDGTPAMADLDRPLTPRGRDDARLIGVVLTGARPVPDLVLCSPSVRTRQTVDYAGLPGPPKTIIEPAIYEAMAQDILAAIKALPSSSGHVLVVGHNPGMHMLALALAAPDASDDRAIRQLRKKFPKGALASFEFDIAAWPETEFGAGRLTGFTRPKELRQW